MNIFNVLNVFVVVNVGGIDFILSVEFMFLLLLLLLIVFRDDVIVAFKFKIDDFTKTFEKF